MHVPRPHLGISRNTSTHVLLFVALCFALLLPTQTAHAQFGSLFGGAGAQEVHVVRDTSGNLVANEATRGNTEEIQGLEEREQFKDFTLDSIAWSISQKLLQEMTASTIQWINSGFQGSPAFVTDLDRFLLDTADQVAGEFIYGSELDFLCEPIEFQVRVAIEQQYINTQRDTYEPQCTLSDITNNLSSFMGGNFSSGGWPAFFELAMGSHNDPNKAYFSVSGELDTRIAEQDTNTRAEIGFGDGILSMKVCESTSDSNGQPRQSCEITTPGTLINEILGTKIGRDGSQALLEADEFNEIVSALFTSLATQALSGSNGLLGLGGNSRYSTNTFGDGGNQSYLAALAADDVSRQQDLSNNPIDQAVDTEEEYGDIQQDIIDEIEDVEDELADAQSDYPNCFDLELSDALENIKDDATENLDISNDTLATLQSMKNLLDSTPTGEQRMQVFNLFDELKSSGALTTTAENRDLRRNFLERDLPQIIEVFENDIDDERDRCAGTS